MSFAKFLLPLPFLLTAAAAPAAAQPRSDVLLIERVQVSAIDRPENGTRMIDVESRFGNPAERHAAVGEPPITRWVYPRFTVYFEHDIVIYSVVNRASEGERGPRPPR